MEPSSPHLFLSTPDKEQWRRVLDELKGNIYHSFEWAETCRTDYSKPLFYNWTDAAGRTVGIAVGIESRSSVPYVGRFSKRLDFESYPAVRQGDVNLTRAMIKQLSVHARNSGCLSLSIQSYGSNVMLSDLDQLGFETRPRIEFIVDLTKKSEELWKGLSENHRRKIKKAKAHSLYFLETCESEGLRHLAGLQNATRQRRNRRGEQMDALNESQLETPGKKYFDSNLGKLYLMVHEQEPVSAAFVGMYAGRAIYIWGGSSEQGNKMNAPALLFWKVFERCRELGCREFNLGGVPAAAESPESLAYGLFRFKSGFGGRRVRLLSGTTGNLQSFRGALISIIQKGRHAWKSW